MMNGIIKENPTFVLLLGMCPTLGTTSSAINGMGMGLATMFVLICSNVVISAIKNVIPDMVRIPSFIVVFGSKSFCASQYNTVYHNQRNKQAQRSI